MSYTMFFETPPEEDLDEEEEAEEWEDSE